MAGHTIERIVDSLAAGEITIDDFMRAIEDSVYVLQPGNPPSTNEPSGPCALNSSL